jgi:hypothetical protein
MYISPNVNCYSDIGFKFSQNFWECYSHAGLMDKPSLQKRIILHHRTRKYKPRIISRQEEMELKVTQSNGV